MLRISKTREVATPIRGTSGSAGVDFFVPNDFSEVWIDPGEAALIPSGILVDVPDGYALIAHNKSGIALKKRLQIGASVVDSDYQGEIHLHVFNTGLDSVKVSPGMKLVQFLLIPVAHCPVVEIELSELFSNKSVRGTGGFGSTGV